MLIGINGRIGAGKDTAANLLSAMLENEFEITRSSFAAPLKQSAAALFGITLEELEWMKLAPEVSVSARVPLDEHGYRYRTVGLTGRKYLERFGTESHRDVFDQNFWVNQALPNDPYFHESRVVLFTDCRFPNEAERIHDARGYVVEVIGPDGRKGNGHPSDSPLDDSMIDFFIDNSVRDDDHQSFTAQLERLVASIALTQGVAL